MSFKDESKSLTFKDSLPIISCNLSSLPSEEICVRYIGTPVLHISIMLNHSDNN